METKTITTKQVWDTYKSGLKTFILSKVKDRDSAEDILQEVFIKIHLNLHQLKNGSRIKSWIYQISRNAVQDHFRKTRHFVDVEKVEVPDEKKDLQSGELLNCMMPLINKLPPHYREALILSDIKKMGQNRFANRLKISYSGAKSRVQRARRLLLSYFKECCEITADKYGNIVSHTSKGKCMCKA